MDHADVAIIGGGIIGLATAYRLLERYPDKHVIVVEKEDGLAQHQTGRNSGVLHSGIYYRPGSLRATNCHAGRLAMQQFCEREGIDHDICGKVIVATREDELVRLEKIYQRGQQNGVRCEIIEPERLSELEPHAAGLRAIYVPEAGIVNYRQVCQRLGQIVQQAGSQIITGARVTAIKNDGSRSILESTAGDITASYVVNCAGLHSDRVTRMSGEKAPAHIVPFRGEFYQFKPHATHLCNNLIYPVPDPKFPFLGVHFTRMIDGNVECGPNAVLAFAREGYRRRDINLRDLAESVLYPGFLKLASRNWRTGLGEMWRSVSKKAFVRQLQRLVPELQADHLEPAPSGVRAQAVTSDGTIVDDFLIQESPRIVNVCNAPSPAATASLNVGRLVVDHLAAQFDH